jgi:hypothetical protein
MLPDTIEDDTLSKLMEMPSKFYYRDYKLLAAAYDFVVERLAKHIEDSNSASEITKTFIRVRLEDLDLHRKTRLGGVDNLDADIDAQLNLLDHAQQVSARFIGEFFGYRRSATQDEIVRFTMKIAQVKDRNKVRYVNEYTRGGTHWRVSGAGYCVRDTL